MYLVFFFFNYLGNLVLGASYTVWHRIAHCYSCNFEVSQWFHECARITGMLSWIKGGCFVASLASIICVSLMCFLCARHKIRRIFHQMLWSARFLNRKMWHLIFQQAKNSRDLHILSKEGNFMENATTLCSNRIKLLHAEDYFQWLTQIQFILKIKRASRYYEQFLSDFQLAATWLTHTHTRTNHSIRFCRSPWEDAYGTNHIEKRQLLQTLIHFVARTNSATTSTKIWVIN